MPGHLVTRCVNQIFLKKVRDIADEGAEVDSKLTSGLPTSLPRRVQAERRLPLAWLGGAIILFAVLALYFKYVKVLDLSPHLWLAGVIAVGLLAWPRSRSAPMPLTQAVWINNWLLAFGAYTAIHPLLPGVTLPPSNQNLLMTSFALCALLVSAVLLLAGPKAKRLLHALAFAIYAVGVASAAALLLQVFVDFKLFDLATFTNELGFSDTGEVNLAVNNVTAAQIRGRGFLESVHVYATSAAVSLVLGLYLRRSSKFAVATLPVIIAALLVNWSMTAFAALGIALIAWSGFFGRKHWDFNRVVMAFACVAVIGLVTLVFRGSLEEGLAGLMRYGPTDTMSSRISAWDRAIAMFLEHPLLGVGGGGYKILAGFYDGHFFPSRNPYFQQEAHSILFQVLAQWGLIGAFLLGMHFRAALRMAMRANSGLEKALAQAFVVVMLSAMMGNDILLFHPYFFSSVLLTLGAISQRERRIPAARAVATPPQLAAA